MFKKIAKTKDIPKGKTKTFKIGKKERICIANRGGKFFAVDDTCSHEECSLGGGEIDEGELVCPCHGARFDLETGKVLTLPAVRDIKTYNIKVKGKEIFLKLEG